MNVGFYPFGDKCLYGKYLTWLILMWRELPRHPINHISGVQHFHKFFPLRTTLQWWIKQRRKGKMRRTLLQDEGMRFFTHVEFTNYKFMIYFVLSSGWRQNHPLWCIISIRTPWVPSRVCYQKNKPNCIVSHSFSTIFSYFEHWAGSMSV